MKIIMTGSSTEKVYHFHQDTMNRPCREFKKCSGTHEKKKAKVKTREKRLPVGCISLEWKKKKKKKKKKKDENMHLLVYASRRSVLNDNSKYISYLLFKASKE